MCGPDVWHFHRLHGTNICSAPRSSWPENHLHSTEHPDQHKDPLLVCLTDGLCLVSLLLVLVAVWCVLVASCCLPVNHDADVSGDSVSVHCMSCLSKHSCVQGRRHWRELLDIPAIIFSEDTVSPLDHLGKSRLLLLQNPLTDRPSRNSKTIYRCGGNTEVCFDGHDCQRVGARHIRELL